MPLHTEKIYEENSAMRKLALLAIVALCCISGAAFAQSDMPTFCGTLSEADCAIVTNAQETMRSLDSISFDMNVDVAVSNIPDMTAPVTANLSGNGSVTGMQALRGFADMSALAGSDPGTAIADALSAFNLDLSLTLTLPPAIMGEMLGPSAPGDVTLEVRMVDGVGYVNTEPLQPLFGSSSSSMGMQGWFGLDIAGMIQAIFDQIPANMMGEMMSMMESQMGSSMGYMQLFQDPDMLSEFVRVTRTDDGSGDVATFATSVDLEALMSNEQFRDMIMQQIESQMSSQNQEMSDEEMEMALGISEQMMQGMVIKVNEEIGVSDGYLHSITGSLIIDTEAMMNAISASIAAGMGGTVSETEEPTPAPVVNIDFAINYGDYNSVAPITAPEDAQVIPYEMILQSMMGSMGDMGSMGNGTDSSGGASSGGMGEAGAVPQETPESESSG